MDPATAATLLAALVASGAPADPARRLRKARAEIRKLRRSAEEAHTRLAARERRHELARQRLMDALPAPLFTMDSGRRIRTANAAARELFAPRQIIGRPLSEVLLDPRLAAPAIQCAESGKPAGSRVVLPAASAPGGADGDAVGDAAWIIEAAPLRPPAGPEPGVLVALRDVTAEHRSEQIRKDFLANASHELRTPLAIINGYLENLIDDRLAENPELSLRFLKIMRKHSTRIARIIEDMLVVSRLESGEAAALKIQPFPVRDCIEDVLERLESVIRAQQAEIHIDMPDPGLILSGDRFYWTQILFNLVENALKQNPRPGLRIEISCRRENDTLRIHVSDDGVGIPAADLPFVFKRFYRVEKHRSGNDGEIPGTGLGLAIVKRAVQAHGGTIRAESTPGLETKFTIEIPDPSPGRPS